MKRNITITSLSLTLKQDTDIVQESKYVLLNFGPVRAGLTTLQRTSNPQLTELLNCLERKIATLQSKSYTGSAIYNIATKEVLALPGTSIKEKGGINVSTTL